MESPVIIHVRKFLDNPGNPAKCYIKKGQIVVNDEAFQFYPEYAKQFILEHEKGHYYQQTFDEVAADEYALRQLALKAPNSLFNAVQSVRMIARSDPRRENELRNKALVIAAENGSLKAREMLGLSANAVGEPSPKSNPIQMVIVILVVITIALLILNWK